MRKGFLGSLGALLAGAGLAFGQSAPAFRPANGYPYPAAPAGYPAPAMPAPGYPTQPTTIPGYAPPQRPMMAPQYPMNWGYQQPMMAQPAYGYGNRYPQPYYRPAVSPAQFYHPMPQQLPTAPAVAPEAVQAPATPERVAAPTSPERVPAPAEAAPVTVAPGTPLMPETQWEDACPPSPCCPPACEPEKCEKEKKHRKSLISFKKSKHKDECMDEACLDCGDKKKGKKEKCPRECRFWAGADYLYWFTKEGPLPVPVVTSGPVPSMGSLASPGTNVVFGRNDGLDFEGLQGVRVSGGYWLAPCLAIEGVGFLLWEGDDRFRAASDDTGNPLVARPFRNALTGTETSALVAATGVAAGSVDVKANSQLWGVESNLLFAAYRGCKCSFNLLAGARYLSLDEDLDITQNTRLLGGGTAGFGGTTIAAPTALVSTDTFDTRNQFLGGQLGGQFGLHSGKLFVAMTAKVATGFTHQSIDVLGTTRRLDNGAAIPGGLLAQPSNFGRRTDDELTIVPEANLEVGLQITDRLSASLGYSFLYWTRVARPGDQIDRSLNPNQVPTSLTFVPGSGGQPVPIFTDRDFWVQGVNAGFAFRY